MPEPVRVLVVDDDRDTVDCIEKLLVSHDYEARGVTNPQVVLAAVREFKPQVILLDLAMPKLSGISIAKSIRQEPSFQAVPIIAVSGYGDEVNKQAAIEAGFNHLLLKPVQFADLNQAIRAMLPHRQPLVI